MCCLLGWKVGVECSIVEVLSSYFLEDALDSSEVRTHQTEGMMSKGRLLSERRLVGERWRGFDCFVKEFGLYLVGRETLRCLSRVRESQGYAVVNYCLDSRKDELRDKKKPLKVGIMIKRN